MEIVSGPLTQGQILHEVVEIVNSLRSHNVEHVVVTHGWGSNLDTDQLWKEITLNVDDLRAFIQNSIEKGVFSPGRADLFIRDEARTLKFTLCHESDIHLVTDDRGVIDQTVRRWAEKRYGGHKSNPEGGWSPL